MCKPATATWWSRVLDSVQETNDVVHKGPNYSSLELDEDDKQVHEDEYYGEGTDRPVVASSISHCSVLANILVGLLVVAVVVVVSLGRGETTTQLSFPYDSSIRLTKESLLEIVSAGNVVPEEESYQQPIVVSYSANLDTLVI